MADPYQKKNSNPITFDFNDAVKEARNDFGRLLAKTVFLNSRHPAPIHSDEVDEKTALRLALIAHDAAESLPETPAFTLTPRDEDFSIVFFRDDKPRDTGLMGPERSKYFGFNHELGHILIKGGARKSNGNNAALAETAAEAFALIRDIQMYGVSSEGLMAVRVREAVLYLYGWWLVSPVVDTITADALRKDFSSLTPQETIAQAEQYLEKVPSADEENQIHKIYADVRKKYKVTGKLPILEIAQIVEQVPEHSNAYKLGMDALYCALHTRQIHVGTNEHEKIKNMLESYHPFSNDASSIRGQPVVREHKLRHIAGS